MQRLNQALHVRVDEQDSALSRFWLKPSCSWRCYSTRMRRALMIHPDSRCAAVTGIEADVVCPRSGEMALTYRVTGLMSGVRLPAATRPERTDGLWRHTCFEAFVGAGTGYLECNFAPSTQWAAYRFAGYRNGMTPASEIATRPIAAPADDRPF